MTTVRTENTETEAPRSDTATTDGSARKAFVEPKVSSPVDVLEATTFFQAVDSGGTGIRRNGE
ncbi:MAG: hypothetical protein ABIT71_05925 [Vicinamibacteraceae bacterium]